MSRQSFHVKKGDNVTVITGNHKGASGKVLQVLPKKQQVLIEGVRIIKKHTKKSQDNPQGAIVEREGPIHISNVKKVEEAEATSKSTKTKSKKKKTEKAEKKALERAKRMGNMNDNGMTAIQNQGNYIERKPLTGWETYAHALLLSNEAAYVN